VAANPEAVLKTQDHSTPIFVRWRWIFYLAVLASCAGWYGIWLWRHPGQAAAANRQKSHAASRAIRCLHNQSGPTPREEAEQAAQILATYLREQFGLTVAEPTQADLEVFLSGNGCAVPVAARVVGFFQGCDEARFSPPGNRAGNFVQTATELIGAMERAS
jgi:hypothetical protein